MGGEHRTICFIEFSDWPSWNPRRCSNGSVFRNGDLVRQSHCRSFWWWRCLRIWVSCEFHWPIHFPDHVRRRVRTAPTPWVPSAGKYRNQPSLDEFWNCFHQSRTILQWVPILPSHTHEPEWTSDHLNRRPLQFRIDRLNPSPWFSNHRFASGFRPKKLTAYFTENDLKALHVVPSSQW